MRQQGRATRVGAVRGLLPALVSVLLSLPGSHAVAEAGCGGASAPCRIAEGSYRIVLPDTAADGAGPAALIFLHGWGASGTGVLRMTGMIETALARGVAVIAPDGVPRRSGTGLTWGFHPDRPGPRDEIAFLRAVADDAAARHGIDRGRVLLGGFSIGGSMASYLACAAPDAFAAYAPVAGAFWVPVPEACAGPVDLLHTHGWTDTVVPLEGRVLRSGADGVVAQADVWQAMQVWRAANGCRPDASGHGQDGGFWRKSWTGCDSGRRLGFALHDGGHGVPPGWTAMALDWFAALHP